MSRKPYLDTITFLAEGGFVPRDPVEPGSYGYNLSNFCRHAPVFWNRLSAAQQNTFHPSVHALMDRVAKGGGDGREAANQLFVGVRDRTQPFIGGSTTAEPRNQSADTLNYLESMKRIIRPLTEENFNKKYGFGMIRDAYLRNEAMDSSYIRPHSGVWELVYAASKAGIITDTQKVAMGYKYISPADANNPAIMSGNGELPDAREGERGKGKTYLSLNPELAKIINHAAASPEKLKALHYYMHEARIKFFEKTVEVERQRAALGDPEGISLYAAHMPVDSKTGKRKDVVTKGWLNRANASFAYYYDTPEERQQLAAAVKSSANTTQLAGLTSGSTSANSFTLEAQMTASDKGVSVKWGLGKPIGEVAIETPHGLVRYEVNLKTSETGRLIEAPKGVKWVDGAGDATMTWNNGTSLRITPYLNSRIGLASLSKNDFLPMIYDREGNGLDGDDVAKIQRNTNGSIIIHDADSDAKFPVTPPRTNGQAAQNAPRRPNGRS